MASEWSPSAERCRQLHPPEGDGSVEMAGPSGYGRRAMSSSGGEEPPSQASRGAAVAVTRGTSVISEFFNLPRYPTPEILGLRQEDEATARDSDEDGTVQTEPLSDAEEEDRREVEEEEANMPPLVDDVARRISAAKPEAVSLPQPPPSVPAEKGGKNQYLPLSTPQSTVTQLGSPMSNWGSPLTGDTAPFGGSPSTERLGASGSASQVNLIPSGAVSAAANFRFTAPAPQGKQQRGTVKAQRCDVYGLQGDFSVDKQLRPLDVMGNNALLLAARMDDVDAIKAMMREGWDVAAKNYYGEGVLHLAVWGSNGAVAPLLPLCLKQGLSVDARSVLQRTPLHHAAMHGNNTMIDALLRQGADLRAVDVNGQSALHLAVGQHRHSAARLLLERGASPNAQDKQGNSALHLAAMLNLPQLAALLLSHGASKLSVNGDGETPAELAEVYGHDMLYQFISMFAGGEEDGEEEEEEEHELMLRGAEGTRGKLAVRLKMGGHEVVFDDVEAVELSGEHNMEAIIPPPVA